MKLTNKHGLPEYIVRAARSDKYSNGGAWRSVTDLINSPRVSQLRRKHWNDMEEDVTDKIWALLGTATHHLLDEANKEDTTEERLFLEVDGKLISGGVDVQKTYIDKDGITHVRVMDFKVTAAYSVMKDKPEWAYQLNTYAHLIESVKENHVVDELTIVAIIRDFNRRKAQYERDYPKTPILAVPVPLWSVSERADYVKERVRLHAASEVELPRCTHDDQWRRPAYQLWRKGGTKSLRNYDRLADAEAALADGFELKVKWGAPIRCDGNYCKVRDWCSQWREENGRDGTEEAPGGGF